MDQLADHRSVLRTVIPASADVERMGVRRTVLEEFAPHGRAAPAYRDLWREIRGRLDSALPGR
jgi:cellulose biosynthesis protein BcsQ